MSIYNVCKPCLDLRRTDNEHKPERSLVVAMTMDHPDESKDPVMPDNASDGSRMCAFPPDEEACTLVQRLRCREVKDIQELAMALLRRDPVERWMIMCLVSMCREHTAHIRRDHTGLLRKLDRVVVIIDDMEKSTDICGLNTNLKKLLKAVSFYEVILHAYLEDELDSVSAGDRTA